jgi:hypothetical protein
MAAFIATIQHKGQSKVHYSLYIKTENKPDEAESKPAEPVETDQSETQ